MTTSLSSRTALDPPGPAPWFADLGDGTYRNPVLYADYSDPDVIRAGADFWMTASSFHHVPGLPILHSRDLVNWTLVNHALTTLVPRGHFATPRHGAGVWAPSIRQHAGRFWIFYPDPDFGIYVITATDPCGAWSDPHLVLPGLGLIDPCPLWDSDGRCHLVHAWARSRSGISNVITLRELTADGRTPLGPGRTIIDGRDLAGWHTIEGPKLYKRAGWYWIFAPAGGVAEGYQAVFRSRTIEGPYAPRIVLARGRTAVNGPHQGAWVEAGADEHWFVHFQEMPAYGRVVHLQPMRWSADDWPEMGARVGQTGVGEPVLRHPKPRLASQPRIAPATSDDFSTPNLSRQWQWQGNPRGDWARVDAVARTLELRCVPLKQCDSHWMASHLLMQKFPAPRFRAVTSLRFFPGGEGDSAGLMVFGYDYAWIGLRAIGGVIRVVFAVCEGAHEGGAENAIEQPARPSGHGDQESVELCVDVDEGARCQFSFSWDGVDFIPAGPVFKACSGRWVGAKFGLFASGGRSDALSGKAAFQRFRVT